MEKEIRRIISEIQSYPWAIKSFEIGYETIFLNGVQVLVPKVKVEYNV
jgi:hypothetical protein